MTDDPLLGCRLKLQAAWRHRQALGAELEEFLSRTDPQPSPLHLGVIVGDFLHNLRCVLDHVVWQLVELNEQEPGEHNQFPILDTPDAYKKNAGRYLRGVAADHSALIEAFQPYHLGANTAYHSLAVLRDLSNIDKHRFVHPVVIVGEGDAREVRFTELEVTTDALFRLEYYITYTVFKQFENLFPLPTHAVDNLITNAVHDAIETEMDLSRRRPEAVFVGAIADADSLRRQGASITREARYRKLRSWTRQPGRVDLALDRGGAAGRVLMEMKVGKPEEALWDALKLGDILIEEAVATAYLIYAGTTRAWREEVAGADLFLTGGTWHALDLVARWPQAWADLLEGGRGIRPRRGVGALQITPVSWIYGRDAHGHSVQVARVAPIMDAPPQEYDDDGWPVGYTPPRGLRSRVRRTLADQQAGQQAASENDPCHDYPWYSRWTDRRLADVVREIRNPDAFACLRRRLATERRWSEAELQARLDPLRSVSP